MNTAADIATLTALLHEHGHPVGPPRPHRWNDDCTACRHCRITVGDAFATGRERDCAGNGGGTTTTNGEAA